MTYNNDLLLTPQQAQHLVEYFESYFKVSGAETVTLAEIKSIVAFKTLPVENLIDDCTEKEFPAFEVDLGDEWAVHIKKHLTHIYFEYTKSGTVKQASLSLDYEQFKVFTKGCISICQWLEGQE